MSEPTKPTAEEPYPPVRLQANLPPPCYDTMLHHRHNSGAACAACEIVSLRADLARTLECLSQTQQERDTLRAAIVDHRSQKADDRCIEDDDRLYAALDDGIKCDRRVGDKLEMLANCNRFIAKRCESGGWPTYRELEEKITALQGEPPLPDYELLRKFAEEEGGRRTGDLMRRGWITVQVTRAGRDAIRQHFFCKEHALHRLPCSRCAAEAKP